MKIKNLILFICTLSITILTQEPRLYAQDTLKISESKLQIHALPKGVSIYRLDNGLQVLLIENPALPMVGVNVVIKVGSAYETFSTSGMSHMLEHLLFNGTNTRTQKQLYDDVDLIGGYNNASTSDFYTNFMMVTPAENINKGMEIQADMLFNSTLPIEKFEKEKGIVLEELSKSLANPHEQLERNTISILYDGHALSLPTLGTYSTIKSLVRDDVYSFYKNNYVPNNMILTVIGNFNTQTMLEAIKEIYGQASPQLVNRDVSPEWKTGFQMPDFSTLKKNKIYNRFYDGQDIVLQILYETPRNKSPEFYELLSLVLDKNKDEIQNALTSEFPENVKSLRMSTRQSPFINFIEADVLLDEKTDLNLLVNSISNKIATLDYKLSAEVIKSEATNARTDFIKNIEKPHMFGIYNSDELVISGIETVLESYYGSGFYSAAKELEGLNIPTDPIIIIQSPSVKKQKESIDQTTEVKLFNNESTGRAVIAVQNDVSNLLAIHYLIKHKASYESKYGNDAAKILHDCFGQRLKSDENKKISSQYGLTYTVNDNPFIPMDNIYLNPDFGYIRVEGLADDLPGVFDYLNNQFINFVPTEEEYNKAVEQFKNVGMMTMGGDKAKQLFDETYKSIVYEPDPYSENKVTLTYDNLLAFTKEYFQPSNMIISVVSPASPDSINSLLVNFNNISDTKEPPVYSGSLMLTEKDTTVEKDLQGERSYLFWGFTTQIDPDDAPVLQALSLMLADNIIFDIREKQGMAYHMSAGIEVNNDKALFYISQGTRPQNVDTLVSQYPRFFNLATIDTLTQDELEKSINMYLGRMMFRRLSSINKAYYLAYSLYFHNDFNYDKQFLEKLKKVKLSDVKEVAKKYMHANNRVLVVVR